MNDEAASFNEALKNSWKMFRKKLPAGIGNYLDPKEAFERLIKKNGAAVLTDTSVVIADRGKNRFAIFEAASGLLVGTFGDNYQDDRRLKSPRGLALLPDGRVIIGDTGNNRVKVFSSDLASLVASYPVVKPVGVAVSPEGEIFVWNEDGTVAGKLNPNEARLEPLPPTIVPGPIAAMT